MVSAYLLTNPLLEVAPTLLAIFSANGMLRSAIALTLQHLLTICVTRAPSQLILAPVQLTNCCRPAVDRTYPPLFSDAPGVRFDSIHICNVADGRTDRQTRFDRVPLCMRAARMC